MPTEPFKLLLDRDGATESSRELRELTCPVLQEAINYATHVFARCVQTNSKPSESGFFPPIVLFRHAIQVADAVEVSLSRSSVMPANMLLRNLFETMVSLMYMCKADSERRGMAWLYHTIHSRAQWMKGIANPDVSGIMAEMFRDAFASQMTEQLKFIRDFFDSPHWRDVRENIKQQKKFRYWYSLFGGPINLRCLAEHVGVLDEYVVRYKSWSSEAHATSTYDMLREYDDGRAAFVPIRSPEKLLDVGSTTLSYLLRSTGTMIQYMRPDECEQFRKWHDKEVRLPAARFRRTSVSFDVIANQWEASAG